MMNRNKNDADSFFNQESKHGEIVSKEPTFQNEEDGKRPVKACLIEMANFQKPL